MKRIAVFALLALAGVVGMGKALAQNEVRVKVPFDFAVGNKTLPAGTYSITPVSEWAIEIQNRDTNNALLTVVAPDSNQRAKNVLVFTKYSGHYFLREILCDSASMNVDLPTTKIEQRAHQEEAKNPTDGGQVLLALK
jgi:hypothetical protein